MIGEEAAMCRQMLEINYPMENGIVRSWEDMRHIWSYTFNEKMGIDPTNAKVCKENGAVVKTIYAPGNPVSWWQCALTSFLQVLLTEPPLNPKINREKMVEIMFEEYGFKGVYISIQAVLTLYAQGM